MTEPYMDIRIKHNQNAKSLLLIFEPTAQDIFRLYGEYDSSVYEREAYWYEMKGGKSAILEAKWLRDGGTSQPISNARSLWVNYVKKGFKRI